MSQPAAHSASAPQFYAYVGADGTLHVVDKLSLVPAKYRDSVQKLHFPSSPKTSEQLTASLSGGIAQEAERALVKAQKLSKQGSKQVRALKKQIRPTLSHLDLPSAAIGFAAGLILILGISILRVSGRWILKLALIAVIIMLLAGAYLGAVRRVAGLSPNSLASPQAIINDAKKAVRAEEKRIRKQQRILGEIAP